MLQKPTFQKALHHIAEFFDGELQAKAVHDSAQILQLSETKPLKPLRRLSQSSMSMWPLRFSSRRRQARLRLS